MISKGEPALRRMFPAPVGSVLTELRSYWLGPWRERGQLQGRGCTSSRVTQWAGSVLLVLIRPREGSLYPVQAGSADWVLSDCLLFVCGTGRRRPWEEWMFEDLPGQSGSVSLYDCCFMCMFVYLHVFHFLQSKDSCRRPRLYRRLWYRYTKCILCSELCFHDTQYHGWEGERFNSGALEAVSKCLPYTTKSEPVPYKWGHSYLLLEESRR